MNVLLLNKNSIDNKTVLKVYKKIQSEGHNVLRIADAITKELLVSNMILSNDKEFYKNIFYSIDTLLDKCDEVWTIEDDTAPTDVNSWIKGVAFGKHKTIRVLTDNTITGRVLTYNASPFCIADEVDSVKNYLNNKNNVIFYNLELDTKELAF